MKRRNLALLFPLILLGLALTAFVPGDIWGSLTPTVSAPLTEPVLVAALAATEAPAAAPTVSPVSEPQLILPSETPFPEPVETLVPEPVETLSAEPTVDVPVEFTEPAIVEPAEDSLVTVPTPLPPDEVHVPILMYHYISSLPADADSIRRGLTVEPHVFAAQLQYLHDNGYTTITLNDIYHALTVGQPLPEKPIVLTFDDGYVDAYTEALPLLQQYSFVGEFFVLATPAHYEAPAYMTWEQVHLLSEAGMSLQGHGRDHYDLRNRSYEFLVYQILGIKEAVEAHTNRPVTFFCYPAGKYDADTLAVVESAGYWGGVTTEWGATQRLDNRYTWPRIRVQGTWALEQFASVLTALAP